jgi:hypothetical protein
MGPGEWSYWTAYDSIEPFGPWREDYRAGVIASTVANFAGKECTTATVPRDFMLNLEEAPPEQPDDVPAKFQSLFS